MTAALHKVLPGISIARRAFLLGSVAPDLPLWGLSIGGMIYYQGILGWNQADTFRLMFDQLFFQHPLWIISHNFLHAPVLLLVGLAVTWRSRSQVDSLGYRLFWFCLACLLHTSVDILTHVDDGPLIYFPWDWITRFRSSVSYYDDRYYGREFQFFEQWLNIVLLVYLLRSRVHHWLRRFLASFSE